MTLWTPPPYAPPPLLYLPTRRRSSPVYAAIGFINSTFNTGGSPTIPVTKPAGVLNGHAMYVFFVSDTFAITLAGWVNVFSQDNAGARFQILRKFANGEGASWTFTIAGGNIFTAGFAAYSGVDTTTPEDGVAVSGTNGSASPATAPTKTPNTDNAFHVILFGTASSQTSLAGPPAGYTQDLGSSGAAGDFVRIDHKLITPIGATGAQTSATQVGTNIGVSIILRAAAAAAGAQPLPAFGRRMVGWA